MPGGAFFVPGVVATSKPNPRRSNGHARTCLRKRVAAMGLPCALCGKAIDYSLPPGHPWSFELDEKTPVSLGGDPLNPDNVQPAHRICNQRKGNGKRIRRIVLDDDAPKRFVGEIETSQAWD